VEVAITELARSESNKNRRRFYCGSFSEPKKPVSLSTKRFRSWMTAHSPTGRNSGRGVRNIPTAVDYHGQTRTQYFGLISIAIPLGSGRLGNSSSGTAIWLASRCAKMLGVMISTPARLRASSTFCWSCPDQYRSRVVPCEAPLSNLVTPFRSSKRQAPPRVSFPAEPPVAHPIGRRAVQPGTRRLVSRW